MSDGTDRDPEIRQQHAELGTPLAGVLPEPPLSAENPDADPDLERWQHDRWAPHPLIPEEGQSFEHERGDGSFHDRTLEKLESEPEAPKPRRRRK